VIRAIIIEDELNSLKNLENLIKQNCPTIEIVGTARSCEEGKALLDKLKDGFDLAFMDIQLSDGLIFTLLDSKKQIDFNIIFVTAFAEYAVQAFRYSSIDYILKPIDPDKLKEAVSRVVVGESTQMTKKLDIFREYYNNPNAFSKMSISAIDGIYFVNIRDICRLQGEDNYTHIFLDNGQKITISKTIKTYVDLLSDKNFFRVHKKHLINLNFMKKFVKGDGGYLIMDDDTQIEVSRRRRPAFIQQLKDMQMGL